MERGQRPRFELRLSTTASSQTQSRVGSSAFATNNATFLARAAHRTCLVSFGSKKTVIRAGFGIYYALLDNLSYRLDQNRHTTPVVAVEEHRRSRPSRPTANYRRASKTRFPSGVDPNLKTPTMESYSLKIEQQIAPNTTLSVGYIGSHGYHELLSVDAEPADSDDLPGVALPCRLSRGAIFYPTNAPLANHAFWNSTHWISQGISSYNGLEVDVNHRISHGLQFRGVYTYSKSLDDGDSMNTSVATNSPAFVANPLRPMADYGRASFDIAHVGVINATYDLPLGRGTASNELVKSRVELADQRDRNHAVRLALHAAALLQPIERRRHPQSGPSFAGIPTSAGPVILGGPNRYFNPGCFHPAAHGTYGNVGRNVLQGPNRSKPIFRSPRESCLPSG